METKLNDILSDYDISAPERTVERVACEVINKQCNTELETNEVRYQQGTLWIDTTPLTRSQIHMKKSVITEKISEQLDKRSVSQIN